MRAPRGPARALTIQGARPESVRSPAGPRVSESRNGSPTHRGVCVRGSLCAGRGRVRPCVTVRGVCGCLWRGGEMPMAAVHACAHRWAWACRRVDACAATGVGRARRGACAGVCTSVPVRCPRCARGCEASPRGSPCCLAHPTLTRPTRCSHCLPGPRSPRSPAQHPRPPAPCAQPPSCLLSTSLLLCQEPPPHTQARPWSPDSAVTSLCGSCPHSQAAEPARPSPAPPQRPRGPSCPPHPRASCHPTPGVLDTSCWLGLGAGREMGRGEGQRWGSQAKAAPAPAGPG